MARIVVTTFGSTGDLNPFIALGIALRSRGHEVLFAVEANFQQQLSLLGFPVHLLTGDQEKALAPFHHQIFDNGQPLTSLKLLGMVQNHVTLLNSQAALEEYPKATSQ